MAYRSTDETNILTPATEEALTAIYEMSCGEGGGEKPVRICELAERLHVSPSSASRMAQTMSLWQYVDFKRYGYIMLTDKGRERGSYLKRRADVTQRFFIRLTGNEQDADWEKISHFLSKEAVDAMEAHMNAENTVLKPS